MVLWSHMSLTKIIVRDSNRRPEFSSVEVKFVLVGRSEGKEPLGTRRHRWEDNVKIGIDGANW